MHLLEIYSPFYTDLSFGEYFSLLRKLCQSVIAHDSIARVFCFSLLRRDSESQHKGSQAFSSNAKQYWPINTNATTMYSCEFTGLHFVPT